MPTITFIVEDEGNPISITYDDQKTIKDFLTYYVKTYTNYETLNEDVYKFKIGSKLLNASTGRFLNKKISELIQTGTRIVLSRSNELSYSKLF